MFAQFFHAMGSVIRIFLTALAALAAASPAFGDSPKPKAPTASHPVLGTVTRSADGAFTATLVSRRQNYRASERDTYDAAINSPKSVNIHPDGGKLYVNSLEGASTVVYDARSMRRLKVIRHVFDDSHRPLWARSSGLFPFTHYTKNLDTFTGKPVESTFSHDGRYLWVPYYRRSYDINAQDPSAMAVIDTRTDEIVRLMETGPLPKMVATSPDGRYVAVTHWGDNTVGLIDIDSDDPALWRYVACFTVDRKLKLDYSLTKSVNRDTGSGNALRGTAFTPDGRYLLVGCMGGMGGIAVIDMPSRRYVGKVYGMRSNMRHLVIQNGWLYLSINKAGVLQRTPLRRFVKALEKMKDGRVTLGGWEESSVDPGARTLVLTPDGRYAFLACNSASTVCAVDTRTMRRVARIPVDSYPVGMDISSDGKTLYVTQQGRDHRGGNCVDIINLDWHDRTGSVFGRR